MKEKDHGVSSLFAPLLRTAQFLCFWLSQNTPFCFTPYLKSGPFFKVFHLNHLRWVFFCCVPDVYTGSPSKSDGKESTCNAATKVWSLGWEDPLENGMATHSRILAIGRKVSSRGHKESDRIQQLMLFFFFFYLTSIHLEQLGVTKTAKFPKTWNYKVKFLSDLEGFKEKCWSSESRQR